MSTEPEQPPREPDAEVTPEQAVKLRGEPPRDLILAPAGTAP